MKAILNDLRVSKKSKVAINPKSFHQSTFFLFLFLFENFQQCNAPNHLDNRVDVPKRIFQS